MPLWKTVSWTLIVIQACLPVAAAAEDLKVIDIAPNSSADVYFEINLSGNIYLNIQDSKGAACADFWWIVWPLGSIKGIGEVCGRARVSIPGFFDSFAISAKLRVRSGPSQIKIGASASESVAYGAKLTF